MKKKDNIEELVLKHLDKLNNTEPNDGHFERFEAKLKAQKKRNKLGNFNLIWKVAAIVIFALLAVNQGAIYLSPDGKGFFQPKNKTTITLASISPEYQEVEFYYTNAIHVGLDQWNQLKNQGAISQEEQDLMGRELKEFEQLHASLQIDLAATPNNERVINAMLVYYQSKLEVITMIVEKLKEVQQLEAEKNTDTGISI
ncbi:MAG: hypothetical protein JXR61_05155 [Prolixibacteraceae bacterium]|nr:hypothetical protein [Prolixibacteraceae bacterium]